ncbi:MAG: hypothetical protein IPN03_24100 [Holophagales bacterium]|nr:hypothetical protein [Holophagales bacterium]
MAGDPRRRDAVPGEEVAGAAGVSAEDEARVAQGRESPGRGLRGCRWEWRRRGGARGRQRRRSLPDATSGNRWARPPRAGRASYDRVDGDLRRRPSARSRFGRGRRGRESSAADDRAGGDARPDRGGRRHEVVLEGEISRLAAIGFLPRREGEAELAYRDRLLDLRVVELLREKELRLLTGLEPDPAEVNAKLDVVAARYEAGAGEPFDRVLERARTSRDEVRDWIRRGMALESYAREAPADGEGDGRGMRAFYDGPFRTEAAAQGVETLPPFAEVQDQVRELQRERLLNEEVEKWTEGLRAKTRVLVYRRPPIDSSAGSASR